jgi:hypothetical protein
MLGPGDCHKTWDSALQVMTHHEELSMDETSGLQSLPVATGKETEEMTKKGR